MSDYDTYTREKAFRNGDSYVGGWRKGPEAEGQYTWDDGSYYRGLWQAGKKHGIGKYVWPSGATYQGEWKDGHMHGVGTFEAPNGSRYQGSWSKDVKHGLGKQVFSTGDVYEGIWKRGMPEGPGRYKWANKFEYDGEWRAGRMHGQGTFVWASGEKYDGEWKDGLQDGLGTHWSKDGSLYDGMWCAGYKHGIGLYRPPPPQPKGKAPRPTSFKQSVTFLSSGHSKGSADGPATSGKAGPRRGSTADMVVCTTSHQEAGKQTNPPTRSASCLSYEGSQNDVIVSGTNAIASGGPSGKNTPRQSYGVCFEDACDALSESSDCMSPTHKGRRAMSQPFLSPAPSGPVAASPALLPERSMSSSPGPGGLQGSNFAYVRFYEDGMLLREARLPVEDANQVMDPIRRRQASSVRAPLIDSKAGLRMGKTISRGHQSYNLMLNLQLGIRYSVARISTEPAPRDPPPEDFQLKVKQYFPQEGSDMTPVHTSDNFMWKDYAPMVFRKLREIFNIDAGEYMLSLCSDAALRLLNTPGKSGAVFFLSGDDQFFVKTLKKGETKLLFSMLPEYYRHVASHPHTLLTKFYGLHRITLQGRKFDLVVMANLFNTRVLLHNKFDLKGSTLGRTAGLPSLDDPITIYKDLDLNTRVCLERGWHDRLMYQIQADCQLLEACEIMDYSMLLGIHYPKRIPEERLVEASGTEGVIGGARNFDEHDQEAQFRELFPRLSEKVARLKVSEQAKTDLMQLVEVHLKGGTRQQASAFARLSSVPRPSAASGPPHRGMDHESTEVSVSQQKVAIGPSAEELAMRLGQSRVQLGVNMPARCMPNDHVMGGMPEDVVLYFGIIDILQAYNPSKRIEHRLKSLVHDSHSISVTNPRAYAQRFQAFMKKVFI